MGDYKLQKDLLLVDFKSTVLTLLVLNRVAMVREKSGKIRFYSRSGKSQGVFLSAQGVSKSLFKVSEKSGNFILRLPQIMFLDVFI